MKKFVLSLLCFVFASSMFAAGKVNTGSAQKSDEPYNIQVSMKDMKDTTIYLAFYFNGKTYSKDTTMLDSKGVGVFSGKNKKSKRLDEGMYIVYFKQDKYFDLLVGSDQNIKLSADTTDLNPKITAGKESMLFGNLVKFISEKNKERKNVFEQLEKGKIDTATYRNKVKSLNEAVDTYQKQQIAQNEGNFFASFVKGTIGIEIPTFEELPDTAKPMARYQFAKNHFFDNIDLSDQRFLRTPYFPSKVDQYMQHYILQIPDSLLDAAINLIEKSRGDSVMFQSMVTKMMNYALKSQQMGMDKMWYNIAEKYYLSGEATWADTAWLKDLQAECKKVKYNQIGMKAKNLTMRDKDSSVVKLSDIFGLKKHDFILVYFFEPSCGHCKKITPVLHDSVYVKYKDKGFEVFCCYTQTDKKEWLDFLDKHNLHDWVNVWDPGRESYFWEFYDATVTPGVYLINNKGEIVAKKISTESLDMILNEELIVRKNKNKETNPASEVSEKNKQTTAPEKVVEEAGGRLNTKKKR